MITGAGSGNCRLNGAQTGWGMVSLHPWGTLNAVSYSAPDTAGTITGVQFKWGRSPCSALITGTVNFEYINNAGGHGKFALLNNTGTLHIVTATSCGALLAAGDPVYLDGTYQLNPNQTITSP